MSHLVAIAYDDLDTAQQVVANIGKAQAAHEIELDDLVIVERRGDGKIKLHQPSLAGAGAAGGALWGGLIGLIFLMPLFGMAIGAAQRRGRGHAHRRGRRRQVHEGAGHPARRRAARRSSRSSAASRWTRCSRTSRSRATSSRRRSTTRPRRASRRRSPRPADEPSPARTDEAVRAGAARRAASARRDLIPTRTLLQLFAFGVLVALAHPLAGHAAVDLPRRRARARARPGGRRARAARLEARPRLARRVRGAVRRGLRARAVTAGPVWDEIVDFVKALPAYWDELTRSRRSRS